jgi:PAS domain S-box-containing protein
MVLLTNVDNSINWVNKAFEDQTGYKLNELWGELPSDFLSGPDTDYEVIKTIRQKKAAKETFSRDLTYYTRSGEKHWVNGEFTPLFDDNGIHTGYITVYNNITLRKKNEDEVRRQNGILKEVAWISSHEVRKPVANIMGLVALIKASPNQEEKAHLISLVDKCAEDLDEIVHSIDAKIYSEKNMNV